MDRHDALDAETVTDALDVLHDLVLWELAPKRWELVAAILERIAAAIDAGDDGALRVAVAKLELTAPVRALRIGSRDPVDIPKDVLDRQNTLVHALTTQRSRSRTGADKSEGGRGEQPAR